jgi:hypothetical protein
VDYKVEVKNAKEYGWGDTLFFGWDQPYGFATVRTNSVLQGLSQSKCGIICMVIEPKSRSKFGEVLQHLQSYAYKNQASQITIPVNAVDSEVLQEAMTNNFQISGIMLRMIYQGKYMPPEGIDLSGWAM